ncbi:uncharacterized protein At5g08430 isoform X7 [Carya illinoinensis]|uniref:uncharacterized protein At5g08430 isoform X7 n=1 Tax=Carya illinoinensis TaxID=32201 RepID=UPI001C71FF9D|nr:uncharacterized protein At5g08430 isoform X7 [Carya illinoinensis]
MAGRVESAPFDWMEENSVHQYETPVRTKRKVRSKKKEFLGWGSRQLIEFLQSIGKDTSEHISQYDAAAIINDYVNNNHLLHPTKKKRILCDERLHSVFGRKTVSRIKIHDLLEPHFAENQEESDEVFSYSSDERENVLETYEQDNISSMERTTHQKKKVSVTPTSCFAALNPHNIKLVYLRKSLVEDLLKDPETFEDKLLGSFVRIKSDPNDYLQKNSHQLVQVTGIKKASGTGCTSMEVLLQVSGVVKDIRIGMLSDDNFSSEECKDLNQRVKDGLLKRPTVYLEKKQLLETPDEQSRLLHEVPKVIADEVEPEATLEDILDNVEQGNNGSPRSILNGASEVPFRNIAANGVASTWTCQSTDFAEFQHDVIEEQPKQPSRYIDKSNGETQLANIESNKEGGMMVEVMTSQVIDLSDDEEKEEPCVGQRIPDDRLGSLLWHYLDPQGEIQGPFSLTSLKRWSDAYYFPSDFKVWKTGQNQDEAVLLKNILH